MVVLTETGPGEKIKIPLTLTYAHPNPWTLTLLPKIEVSDGNKVWQRWLAVDLSLRLQKIHLSFSLCVICFRWWFHIIVLYVAQIGYVCSFGFIVAVHLKQNCTPSYVLTYAHMEAC